MSKSAFQYSQEHYSLGPHEGYAVSKSERQRIQTIVGLVGTEKTVLDVGCFDGTIGVMIQEKGNIVYGTEGCYHGADHLVDPQACGNRDPPVVP